MITRGGFTAEAVDGTERNPLLTASGTSVETLLTLNLGPRKSTNHKIRRSRPIAAFMFESLQIGTPGSCQSHPKKKSGM
jgi:hypothetical protein